MRRLFASLVVTTFVAQAGSALAADPALICQSGKLKAAAKYASCRLSAESKAVRIGVPADFAKCIDSFSSKWGKIEAKAGPGTCVTESDESAIGEHLILQSDAIRALLSDQIPLDSRFPATGQTTSYGSGDDGDVRAGAVLSFRDNHDGTITD